MIIVQIVPKKANGEREEAELPRISMDFRWF